MKRCKGFSAIVNERASFSLVKETVNYLRNISSFIEGYYHYYFTVLKDGKFEKELVKFKELKNGYNFIINNTQGFIITRQNANVLYIKLIKIVPVMFLLEMIKKSFNGSEVPLCAMDFLYTLYDFTGGTLPSLYGNINISFPSNEKAEVIITETDNETHITYEVLKTGTSNYISRDTLSKGKIEMHGDYDFTSFLFMSELFSFMNKADLITSDIYFLAPLGLDNDD